MAEVARLFAVRLRTAIGEHGIRETARTTGIAHPVLSRILNGTGWADTHTLARLEHTLNTALWPAHATRRGRHQ
ncbi:MAG: helix-turn-helix transcriptional regulator [Ilumatobacteraceae bacterium]